MITDKLLADAVMCPIARAVRWAPHLRVEMQRNGITTARRATHFIAQLGHESLGLSRIEENLNYTAARLLEVFPRYFTESTATTYARQPERIGNHVYANRLGNRSEASGDGWRYRGRGPIMITGLDNYRRMGLLLGLSLVECPQLLLEIEHAAASAAAWWRAAGLNAVADRNDVLAVSRGVNLGDSNSRRTPNGLLDRVKRTQRAAAVLGS